MSRRLAVLLAIYCVVPLAHAAPCATKFASPPNYTHGTILTVGDFDGDGHADTLTALPHESRIRVNFGTRAGTFRSGPMTEIASQLEREPVRFEAIANDWNRDRRLDIALLNGSTGGIEILLGRGNGTFGTSTALDYLPFPRGIVTADFDGDGQLDLAAGDSYVNRRIAIIYGNGDGTFAPPQYWDTAEPTTGLLAADFDRNGRAELVVAQTWGVLDVYTFHSNRTIGTPLRLQMASDSFGWIAEDVDDDGKLDIAAADLSQFVIGVFRGNGDGTFKPREDWAAGVTTEGVALADVTGDGLRDFVAGNGPSGTIVVLPGFGRGEFGLPVTYPAGSNLYGVHVLDVNDDGLADVLANDLASYTVLLQQPDGGLPYVQSMKTAIVVFGTAGGDFNEDGFPDIAVPDYDNSVTEILAGDRAGGVSGAGFVPLGERVVNIEAADVNGDDNIDLVAGRRGAASIALGSGDGTFAAPFAVPLPSEEFYLIGLGDLDSDGDLDLAATDRARNVIELLANDGSGVFTARATVPTLGRPGPPLIADVNGDGIGDVIYTIWEDVLDRSTIGTAPPPPPGSLAVRHGRASWTFDEPRKLGAGHHPYDVKTADLDGDDDLDLIVSTFGSEGDVRVFRNDGAGTFTSAVVLPVFGQVLEAEMHDFNRDGLLDIAASQVGYVHIFHGLGDLQFGEPVSFVGGNSTPLAAVLADFDGDGRTDIATTGRWGETSVHLDVTACRRRAVRP